MRLVALSNERLNPWINWTTLGPPLLSALAYGQEDLVVTPPALHVRNRAELRRSISAARRADTLFWMQGTAHPEWPVWAVAVLAGTARRSAFVVDPWKPSIAKIGALAVAQRLNPCFIPYTEGLADLSAGFPRGRFEWLPFGADTDVFDGGSGERDIFAFWMGRRHEVLHDALTEYCATRGLLYRFSLRGGEFADPRDLGRVAGRAKYFVVSPPDLNDLSRTGGYSPLVMRYLEGLSAGARLLGVLPRSGEFEKLLPREAILEVAADGSDLADRLDEDLASGSARDVVEYTQAFVRTHHSWRRRAEQIRDRLEGGEIRHPAPFNA